MNHLTECTGCAGLAPFVGGNFHSLVFSPATVVYGAEIIRQARAFAAGFAMDEGMVGFDEITETGPGGHFLGAGLTLQHFREVDPGSTIWPRLSLEAWQGAGVPRADALLRRSTARLLAGSGLQRIDGVCRRRGLDPDWLTVERKRLELDHSRDCLADTNRPPKSRDASRR
jgi:hypothetical protein